MVAEAVAKITRARWRARDGASQYVLAIMRLPLIWLVWLFLMGGCASISPQTPLKSGHCVVVAFVGSYLPDFRQVIDSAGDIAPPLVGKVHIAGLTVSEAAALIARAYQVRAPAFRVEIAVARCR